MIRKVASLTFFLLGFSSLTFGQDKRPGLDRDQITKAIETNVKQVMACYEAAKSTSRPTGRVVVSFDIQADGHVINQRMKQTTLHDQDVENCIVGKVGTWVFPKPVGGALVHVDYPFLLKKVNPPAKN